METKMEPGTDNVTIRPDLTREEDEAFVASIYAMLLGLSRKDALSILDWVKDELESNVIVGPMEDQRPRRDGENGHS